MAFIHGKKSRLAIGGFNIWGDFRSAQVNTAVDTADTSSFGATVKTFVIGLVNTSASFGALHNDTTNAVTNRMDSIIAQETAVPVSYAPGGFTIGKRTISFLAYETTGDIAGSSGDMVSATYNAQATGVAGHGVSLCDLETVIAYNGGGNLTSVNNQATAWVTSTSYVKGDIRSQGTENYVCVTAHTSGTFATDLAAGKWGDLGPFDSTSGADLYLHLVANTLNAGSVTVKVQHSTNGSSWADLATFTSANFGTVTSEKKSVAGTVNRYLRAVVTISGAASGNLQLTVSACRL